ncbi:hypothetical protein SSX86_001627 [Deinandra increscens subsp. villosa]|uniref:Uncharacterized protein n=1 Tax=Deinandra increscens subsp. villosa TaxID=3103831 RepID=A0AAP0DWJ5_9ASTR
MILNLQAVSLTTHHAAAAPLGQGRGPLWKVYASLYTGSIISKCSQHLNLVAIIIIMASYIIFYHAEPTDVRKQQKSFGEAMGEHKLKMEKETGAEKRSQWGQRMEVWKRDLAKVADLKGVDEKDR